MTHNVLPTNSYQASGRPSIARRSLALALTAFVFTACGTGATQTMVTTSSTTSAATSPTSSEPTTVTTTQDPVMTMQGWIAYQSSEGLALVRPDGTDRHTLLPSSANNPHHPDWSPDGSLLAYVTDEPDGTTDIWIANGDGTEPRRFVDCQDPCVYADDPAWSPDGKQIAYWTNDDDTNTSTQVIRIGDAMTGAIVAEIPGEDLNGPIGPRWSPDGHQLVLAIETYIAEGGGFTKASSSIGVIDLTESDPGIRVITPPDLMFPGYPDWSPTGELIVFEAGNPDISAQLGTPPNLFTVRPDGTELTQITDRGVDEPWIWLPTWTDLDDHPILVTLNDGSRLTLARVSEDGSDLLDILDERGNPIVGAHTRFTSGGAAYAEQARWIAYQGSAGGPSQIRLVRSDGSEDHALASNAPGDDQLHPDWSPDGSQIAFAIDESDGTRDLWIASFDGTGVELLYDCVAPCSWADDPAWSPDGRQVLFQSGTAVGSEGNGLGTLEVVDVDSGAVNVMYTGSPTEYFYVPRWSADGHNIAVEVDRFATARLDEEQVVGSTVGTIDLEAGETIFTSLLPFDSQASSPDWLPGGDLIVFVRPTSSDAGDSADLWTVRSGGSDLTQVTFLGQEGGRAIQPSWTANGSLIVFIAETIAGKDPVVGTISPDGSGLNLLPESGVFRTHPRFSPEDLTENAR